MSGVPGDLISREIRDVAQAPPDAVMEADESVKNIPETEREINKNNTLEPKTMEKPQRMVFHKKELTS